MYTSDGSSGILLENLTVKLELHQTILFFFALFVKLVHKKIYVKQD